MSREILQDIISDFSPEKFARFFRAKHRSFSPRQEPFSQYNDPAFADGMKFGEIQFSPDEKLIVCAFKAAQSLSERSSRKAQYEMGKKILRGTQSDAGIFIFHDSRGNFRFSLIYPEAAGTRRQWSNFRRFTYFASPELTNKTFLTRVGDGDFSSLEKIKDAFSVEKVTKEFYEQYRKLFEALVVDLDSNQTFRNEASRGRINTPDFAKKLLGQVVFLYFLQKKGWLGVPQNKPWGEGDKNFISNLYRRAVTNKENFFNDYLEVLFYDTLNNAHREGADTSFSRYFNCRIPFLNGGLFEPEYDWHGTTIHLDNGVFKNIFEVFDRYNFTVEEESPDDKEVAVDPEMLGKVFENLLEENLRKGKGTYYTPREIVHYMCRESLVNYLVSQSGLKEERVRAFILRHESGFSADEAKTLERLLKDVKVCDPACGSGAFLVGMLNEIIHARLALDPSGSEYALKKETIQNCVYGVDIDPGAVEIAKLRLWLSLVVDYELVDIEPLPNLDYKIMCGNSLLEELIVGDESIPLFDASVLMKDKPKRKSSDKLMQMDFLKQDADEYLKVLRKLHVEYFHETDTQKKKTLRNRIEKIEMDFIQASVDRRVKELDGRIKNLNMHKPEDRKKNAELMTKKLEYMAIPGGIRDSKVRPYFLWHLNFFEVFQEKGGFDVVIANPPYIEFKKLPKSFKEIYNRIYVSARGKYDMYVLFIESSHRILRSRGHMVFINPTTFLKKDYGVALRNFIRQHFRILQIFDFADLQVFEGVTNYTGLFFFRKQAKSDFEFNYHKYRSGDKAFDGFAFASTLRSSASGEFKDVIQVASDRLTEQSWDFHSQTTSALFDKLRSGAHELSEEAYAIFQGIASGKDEVFYVTEQTMKQYSLERAPLFCLLKGQNIKRYSLNWSGYYVIYPYDEDSKAIPESKLKGEYPHVHRYLSERRSLLEGRDYFDNSTKKWYELWNQRKLANFQKLRIVTPEISDRNNFALTKTFFGNTKTYHILLKNPDAPNYSFFLGLLNSSLVEFYYHSITSPHAGGFYAYKTQFLAKIPVRNWPQHLREPVIALVDQILAAKKSDPKVETTRLEHEIDQMVYKLYGLTEEEIEIVENSIR